MQQNVMKKGTKARYHNKINQSTILLFDVHSLTPFCHHSLSPYFISILSNKWLLWLFNIISNYEALGLKWLFFLSFFSATISLLDVYSLLYFDFCERNNFLILFSLSQLIILYIVSSRSLISNELLWSFESSFLYSSASNIVD